MEATNYVNFASDIDICLEDNELYDMINISTITALKILFENTILKYKVWYWMNEFLFSIIIKCKKKEIVFWYCVLIINYTNKSLFFLIFCSFSTSFLLSILILLHIYIMSYIDACLNLTWLLYAFISYQFVIFHIWYTYLNLVKY